MSNFIKLHGDHQGAYRLGAKNLEKTLFLRVDDIEEICDVPNGTDSYMEEVTKKEYEKNKDNPDYYIHEGSPDTYWRYLPTAVITMGHFSVRDVNNATNIILKVRAEASDIVEMVDKSIVDFEVRKSLAVEEALNPPKKQ